MSLGGFRMNYENMSDFEINKAVQRKELIKIILRNPKSGVTISEEDIKRWTPSILDDYCNSWADMGPIMSKFEIGATYGSQTRSAATIHNGRLIQVVDDNELRAAAIVYLMMGEEK
jgi:hypothetical protein